MVSTARSVVLITGCSKGGIGYALCLQVAAKGCIVYATARNLDAMDGLEQHGCILLQLDVTDAAAVKQTVARVLSDAKRIDILVNNAGLLLKGWALETPLADVRRLMEVRPQFGTVIRQPVPEGSVMQLQT
jgi:NAD(P)-dependent dehydrogenase (short-subunit alcohol dehydrogenase family)